MFKATRGEERGRGGAVAVANLCFPLALCGALGYDDGVKHTGSLLKSSRNVSRFLTLDVHSRRMHLLSLTSQSSIGTCVEELYK